MAGGIGFALALAGCAAQTPFLLTGGLDYDKALLTGERLFGEPVPAHEPEGDIAEPSQEMLDYIARVVPQRAGASRRFNVLFDQLHRDGLFDAVYSADQTLTAAQTFESRGGNCLSYTNMFVALARAAGLDARYQVVETPPSWDADAGFLIRYTHINVILKNVRLDHQPGYDVIVDFNVVHPDPDYPRRVVSDDYAESLFYANKSVSALRDNRVREGFAYLRRAIETAPNNVDLWINLGAFYATQGDYESAVDAYEVALQIEPRNKSVLSGLARSYYNMGDTEMAAVYERKVRYYRERNPWYHYALAQSAYEDADYEASLNHIDQAIDLRRRVARFHFLRGLVQNQLGDSAAARVSLEKAERFGLDRAVKLEMLRTLAGVDAT
ncbi:MAG TPA: tetratricopeptide repeat protein [Pseudomonadales bacterium]